MAAACDQSSLYHERCLGWPQMAQERFRSSPRRVPVQGEGKAASFLGAETRHTALIATFSANRAMTAVDYGGPVVRPRNSSRQLSISLTNYSQRSQEE